MGRDTTLNRGRKAALAAVLAAAMLLGAGGAAGTAARADEATPPTLSLTGRDAANPENQTQVQRGGTVEWVATYDDAPDAPSQVRIDQAFSDGQAVEAGSVQVPDGWTVSTSTDGGATFGSTAPGPDTTNVRAEGMLAPGGRGAVASLPKPVDSPQAGGSTSGDGWVPILYKNRSYNIFHHKQPGASGHIMCFDRSVGAPCPGYPARISSTVGPVGLGADDMATVSQPNVYVDATGEYGQPGDMYFPVQRDNDMGVACFNLDARSNCGYHALGSLQRQPASGAPQMWDGLETFDERLYGLGADGKMYCYDLEAGRACTGQPYATGMAAFDPAAHKEAGTGKPSGIVQQHALIDGRVYSVLNYTTQLSGFATLGSVLNCFDPATNAVCAGWEGNRTVPGTFVNIVNVLDPVGVVSSVFEWRDTAGATKGVCAAGLNALGAQIATCYSPAGQVLAGPASPPGLFDDLAPAYTPMRQLQSGNRMYLATLRIDASATAATGAGICYDWTTQAQCDGFDSPQTWEGVNGSNTRDYGYADDGPCIWGLGDTGYLWSFDRETGTNPCTQVTSSVDLEPSTQYYCDGGSDHARGWTEAAVTGVDLDDMESLVMSVHGADGEAIPGFVNRDLIAEGTTSLDLSSIPIADHPRLKVSLDAKARSDEPWSGGTPRLVVGFDGDPVQVCARTVVVDDCSVGDVSDTATSLTSVEGVVGSVARESRKTMNVFRAGTECGLDVAVQKDDKLQTAKPGERLTYQIVVSNNTGVPATGVRLSDVVPAKTAFVSATDGGAKAEGTVTWPAFDLEPGESRTFGLVADVSADTTTSTVVRNVATVTDDGTHGPDADPSNNEGPDDTAVTVETKDTTDPPTSDGSGGSGSSSGSGGSGGSGGSTASNLPFTGANLSWLLQAAAVGLLLGVTFVREGSRRGRHRREQLVAAADDVDVPPFPEAAHRRDPGAARARWQRPH